MLTLRAQNPPRSPLATPTSTASSASSTLATPVDMPPAFRPRSRFTLSSNPPNAKISYRPGDWMYVAALGSNRNPATLTRSPCSCANPGCDAYNFA